MVRNGQKSEPKKKSTIEEKKNKREKFQKSVPKSSKKKGKNSQTTHRTKTLKNG